MLPFAEKARGSKPRIWKPVHCDGSVLSGCVASILMDTPSALTAILRFSSARLFSSAKLQPKIRKNADHFVRVDIQNVPSHLREVDVVGLSQSHPSFLKRDIMAHFGELINDN
jgi:hypothetical protein